jgi:Acyltransferase
MESAILRIFSHMTTLDRPVLASPSQLEILTAINTQDLQASFGLDDLRLGRRLLDALSWLPARRFARQVIAYDQQVAEEGLGTASRRILGNFVGRLEVQGVEHIPNSGPLLVLSNHPGMADTLILFSSLPRSDLRILAGERPFLQALPSVSRHLIYVPDDPGQRMGVVRSAVGHLRRGGTVLTFPAGQIEPDPASMPGSLESLKNWSESIAVFARLVPEVRIVVAIVSGVIWPAALHSPLTRLRRQQKDRERLGAALQMLVNTVLPFYQPMTTRIVFSPAFMPAARATGADASGLMQAILDRAAGLIEQVK